MIRNNERLIKARSQMVGLLVKSREQDGMTSSGSPVLFRTLRECWWVLVVKLVAL